MGWGSEEDLNPSWESVPDLKLNDRILNPDTTKCEKNDWFAGYLSLSGHNTIISYDVYHLSLMTDSCH